jgi:hypothetical protein
MIALGSKMHKLPTKGNINGAFELLSFVLAQGVPQNKKFWEISLAIE